MHLGWEDGIFIWHDKTYHLDISVLLILKQKIRYESENKRNTIYNNWLSHPEKRSYYNQEWYF